MRWLLRTRRQDQSGVAMVTVLLIGAALTAVSSTAAFITISELRAGNNDKKAVAALAYAEAGIDRFASFLKSGQVTYGDLNAAGCSKPPLILPKGKIRNGTYEASLTVYNPNPTPNTEEWFHPLPGGKGACLNRPKSPHPGQGNDQTFFVITSVGKHPAATRTVQQVIALEPIKLPVGVYARSINMQSALHPFHTVSMMSETDITNRRSISFVGNDPYYLVGDFFSEAAGRALTAPVPAAAHAAGTNFLFLGRDPEFDSSTKQCAGNGTQDGANPSQSLWDSDGYAKSGAIASGCLGWASGGEWPKSSKFSLEQLRALARSKLTEQDHQALREAAQRYGVYCSFPGFGGTGTSTCSKLGVQQPGTAYHTYIEQAVAAGNRNLIAYMEFRSGTPTLNNVTERFTVWGCDEDPALDKSVVMVVRNGGVRWGGLGGNKVNGAMIVDGDFSAIGAFEFNGSLVVGGQLNINSSSQKFGVNACWVKNMPGAFFRTLPIQWSEIDRPQPTPTSP